MIERLRIWCDLHLLGLTVPQLCRKAARYGRWRRIYRVLDVSGYVPSDRQCKRWLDLEQRGYIEERVQRYA